MCGTMSAQHKLMKELKNAKSAALTRYNGFHIIKLLQLTMMLVLCVLQITNWNINRMVMATILTF